MHMRIRASFRRALSFNYAVTPDLAREEHFAGGEGGGAKIMSDKWMIKKITGDPSADTRERERSLAVR